MFLLMWASLLFSVSGSNADTGPLLRSCYGSFCITLSQGVITAEAGLCAVIPCSFTTSFWFTSQSVVWFKCEPYDKKCGDSDRIFSRNSRRVKSGFSGRVSLLEPDVRQENCSIIINDLTKSDSGLYQLRVNGLYSGKSDGYTFSQKSTVYVKDLTQKPTVMIPPLTEGQQSTLSCTAPGLCSGSAPEISWTFGGAGEKQSNITGNISESLTALSQTHSSTMTFTPSAKHHGNNVTCKVIFAGGTTTEETVTLNVAYVKEVKITGNMSVTEGQTLNMSCSVESFPPSLITWIKLSDKNLQNGKENLQNNTFTDLENKTETYLQKGSGEAIFFISNVTAKDSGQYICTAKHLNKTLMEKVDVTVIYMKKPVITGNTTLGKGDTLNLTCSVESFPPSYITWTSLGSNTYLQNDTGSATLVIPNVKADHSGRYMCTAKHLDRTVSEFANVSVSWLPSIFENSGCEIQSEVLTCVCISEAFPLPSIKWPPLKNQAKYSVITNVTNHTVKSTISLTIKKHSNISAECVSSNKNGEAKRNLTIQMNMSNKQDKHGAWKVVSWLEVIIAFFLGVLLSAIVCLLARECHRKRQKSSGNLNETVELVTSQEDPLIDADQAVKDDQTYDQEVADGGGAVVAEKAALDIDGGPKDVEYASIDFSVLKRKSAREAAKKRETTETEYAEIKKQVTEQREDNDGEEHEGKEEEVMIGEDEETNPCVPEEEEGEDMAVYSNVKEIMDEI